MSDGQKGCVRCRLWRWWTGERAPLHRLLAYIAIAAVSVVGVWRVETTARTTSDNVAAIQQDRAARTLLSAGNAYAGCQATNAATMAIDATLGAFDAVLVIAGGLNADQRSPEEQAQVDATMARLRAPLIAARGPLAILDCSVHLRNLTPEQRDQVVNTTVPPTVPRPPR